MREPVDLRHILKLTRPLVVFDTETTGTNPQLDRIWQIAITMHYPEKAPVPWKTLINPGIPIPAEIIELVQGRISDEQLAKAPSFKSLATDLVRRVFTNVDYAGHNISFDLQVIRAEFARAGITWTWEGDAQVIDTLRIKQVLYPRDLSTLYEEMTGEKLDGAHDAAVDVGATEVVLLRQLEKYTQLPRTLDALSAFCFPAKPNAIDRGGKIAWKNGEACFTFGKFNGVPLRQVQRGYLEFVCKSDFPSDVKAIVERALRGDFPTKG